MPINLVESAGPYEVKFVCFDNSTTNKLFTEHTHNSASNWNNRLIPVVYHVPDDNLQKRLKKVKNGKTIKIIYRPYGNYPTLLEFEEK